MDHGMAYSTEQFFFDAMVRGWVAKAENKFIPELPGVKAIPYRFEGTGDIKDFYLLDWYVATKESDVSAGSTMIWSKDKPIWVMHYGGSYQERAIDFLKAVLARAYERREFFGGRGQPFCMMPEWGMVYINRIVPNSKFTSFEGREEIFDYCTRESLGWHKYWGIALV